MTSRYWLIVAAMVALGGCGSDTTTAPSVLRAEDIVVGTGDGAVAGDSLTVHYIGTLENGTVFDSSYTRAEPFTFRLGAGAVIRGWDQGLVGIRVGGKRRLTISPDLAYGAQGRPPVIPGNATLVFEIELLANANR